MISIILLGVGAGVLSMSVNADSNIHQNKQKSSKPNIEAGLRSDGELVQAKKSRKLIRHEVTHTQQQQGRMLTSSDLNEASSLTRGKQKTHSPSPVPLTYPTIANTKPSSQKVKKEVKNSNDQFANQQTVHKAYTIPLQNATVSSIRTEQLNNKGHRTVKPVRIKLPIGAKCNKSGFPKNAVIERFGKQSFVECIKGNITLKRGMFKSKSSPKNPKAPKKIKNSGFGDEMPDDLPAG